MTIAAALGDRLHDVHYDAGFKSQGRSPFGAAAGVGLVGFDPGLVTGAAPDPRCLGSKSYGRAAVTRLLSWYSPLGSRLMLTRILIGLCRSTSMLRVGPVMPQ